jgi:hypothetical protein
MRRESVSNEMRRVAGRVQGASSPAPGTPPIGIAIALCFAQDQRMKTVRVLGRIFVVSALTFCTTKAMADDSYPGKPLIQTDFTRVVPTTYPLATTRFNALTPRSYPVFQPGIARVHITEKLVRPIEQPLLRSN